MNAHCFTSLAPGFNMLAMFNYSTFSYFSLRNAKLNKSVCEIKQQLKATITLTQTRMYFFAQRQFVCTAVDVRFVVLVELLQ